MDSLKMLGIKSEQKPEENIYSRGSSDTANDLFRRELTEYVANNSDEIKKFVGIPIEAEYEKYSSDVKFELKMQTDTFVETRIFEVNEEVISNFISDDVKKQLIKRTQPKFLQLIKSELENGRIKEIVLYMSLYGFDEGLNSSIMEWLEKRRDNQYGGRLDESLMAFLWDMYRLSNNNVEFKTIFWELKKKALNDWKKDFDEYSNGRLSRYTYASERIQALCIFLKETYKYEKFGAEPIINPKPKEYMNDNFKIIKEFVVNFPKNKKRLYEVIIERLKSMSDEDLKNYLFDNFKKDKLFDMILIQGMMK